MGGGNVRLTNVLIVIVTNVLIVIVTNVLIVIVTNVLIYQGAPSRPHVGKR